jgi:glutathione-regulated potassium-efflux system ancillary protein KefG
MNKILILFAHPAFKRSKINAALREAVENLEGITFHDLYASYPDFFIDVGLEQDLCEAHDTIVFQHPLYWYSTPAIIKEWMDLVVEHGWACGSTGNALSGKIFFQALTAGGDVSTYLTTLFETSACKTYCSCW